MTGIYVVEPHSALEGNEHINRSYTQLVCDTIHRIVQVYENSHSHDPCDGEA